MTNEEIEYYNARQNLIKYYDKYKEYRNYKDYNNINSIINTISRLEVKLNSIISKYFFTNSIMRRELKIFIKQVKNNGYKL